MVSLKTNDQNRYSRTRDITFLMNTVFFFLSFAKSGAYIAQNASEPLNDIIGGYSSD